MTGPATAKAGVIHLQPMARLEGADDVLEVLVRSARVPFLDDGTELSGVHVEDGEAARGAADISRENHSADRDAPHTFSYARRRTLSMFVPSMRISRVGPSRRGEWRSPSL